MVLIHGQVMHKSEENKSAKSRHAFTFHMVETQGSEYSSENWLQPTPALPFPKLFSDWIFFENKLFFLWVKKYFFETCVYWKKSGAIYSQSGATKPLKKHMGTVDDV